MARHFVPVPIKSDQDRELTAKILKEIGAQRVFLVDVPRFPFEKNEYYNQIITDIAEQSKFYKEQGFEVAVWITTLGYGPMGEEYNKAKAKDFTSIRSIHGTVFDDAFCPLDEDFFEVVATWIKDICNQGIDMIMLDDELCLSARGEFGCACDKHLEKYSELLGETVTIDEIRQKVFAGDTNRYRKVWLKLMGDTMRDYVRKLRSVIDEINPEIRLGFCSGFTSWDLEGVDAIELAKIMAGNTKPFLRFMGAPYWISAGRFGSMTLESVIETVRMQYAWCKDSGVEVFTEDDSYPHNRFYTTATMNELYDLATRVSDDMDCLKYHFEYFSQPDYDLGYANLHKENIPLYEKIKEVYANKPAVGIRVYETMNKFENAELSSTTQPDVAIMKKYAFSQAQMLLSSISIPTTYSGEGICGIAFGENAKYLPESAFENGLILDLKAAEYLQKNGVDVGLKNVTPLSGLFIEEFDEPNDDVKIHDCWELFKLEIADTAKPVSYYRYVDVTNKEKYPSAYLYENAKGQRFLVYSVIGENQNYSSTLFWCYPRAKQILNAVKWLSGGKSIPCVCQGFPHLYCICKEDENAVAVGYFNCSIDKAKNVKVEFDRAACEVEFINCKGKLVDEKTAIIEKIDAYEFAGINAMVKEN